MIGKEIERGGEGRLVPCSSTNDSTVNINIVWPPLTVYGGRLAGRDKRG